MAAGGRAGPWSPPRPDPHRPSSSSSSRPAAARARGGAAELAAQLRGACAGGADGALAPLDAVTPDAFDNGYFRALVERRGLLHSDQELFSGGSQDALVRRYARDGAAFAADFAKAMVRMGNLMPAPGTPLEVRVNCRRPN